jgi:hypothetical protein
MNTDLVLAATDQLQKPFYSHRNNDRDFHSNESNIYLLKHDTADILEAKPWDVPSNAWRNSFTQIDIQISVSKCVTGKQVWNKYEAVLFNLLISIDLFN